MAINEQSKMNIPIWERIAQQKRSLLIWSISFSFVLNGTFMVTPNPNGMDVFAQLSNTSSNSDSSSGDLGRSSSLAPIGGNSGNVTNTPDILDAETIFRSESAKMPASVGSFIILVANEAHESWQDERHKLITDHNPYFIPANLVVPRGMQIIFLNADAPWDTPHPHTIEILDAADDNVVYSSETLDYGNSSGIVENLAPGNYTVVTTEYDAREGTILVESDEQSSGNLIVGGFYTPTHQVENNKDNDGNPHPGWLGYYREEFEKNGFDILSEYNFNYAQCDYCPGGYWIDNKTGDHTLMIFATEQPLSEALAKLEKLAKDNVYV
jgi:hypothetical protein